MTRYLSSHTSADVKDNNQRRLYAHRYDRAIVVVWMQVWQGPEGVTRALDHGIKRLAAKARAYLESKTAAGE